MGAPIDAGLQHENIPTIGGLHAGGCIGVYNVNITVGVTGLGKAIVDKVIVRVRALYLRRFAVPFMPVEFSIGPMFATVAQAPFVAR